MIFLDSKLLQLNKKRLNRKYSLKYRLKYNLNKNKRNIRNLTKFFYKRNKKKKSSLRS